MSKSTNRYGKVIFKASSTTDAFVKPSDKQVRELARLDEATRKQFGNLGIHRYKDLNDQQKNDLHYAVNVARQKAKHERELDAAGEEYLATRN